MASEAVYDTIGEGYARYRQPDPRIERTIMAALGDAADVVNIGAGSGSYEPEDRWVVAIEPSELMIQQRPSGAAPVVQASAEGLPFADGSFGAAMTLLSLHHWADWHEGLLEMCRVARRRVIWTFDPAVHNTLWMVHNYFPGAAAVSGTLDTPPVEEVARLVGARRVEKLLIPADCTDLFGVASWKRPENYLDDEKCQVTSMLAQLSSAELRAGQRRLADDLASGRWHEQHADLLDADEYDGGLRLVIADG